MPSEFTWQNISRTVSVASLVRILPDCRLWYGFQIGRDLDALLPLLSPGVREHVEVVRAELSRVRQLHGRDEVGTEHLRRGEGSERREEGGEESGQNQNHTLTYLFYRANSAWKLHFNNSLTIFFILYNAERQHMRDFMTSQWLERRLRSNVHPKRRLLFSRILWFYVCQHKAIKSVWQVWRLHQWRRKLQMLWFRWTRI